MIICELSGEAGEDACAPGQHMAIYKFTHFQTYIFKTSCPAYTSIFLSARAVARIAISSLPRSCRGGKRMWMPSAKKLNEGSQHSTLNAQLQTPSRLSISAGAPLPSSRPSRLPVYCKPSRLRKPSRLPSKPIRATSLPTICGLSARQA